MRFFINAMLAFALIGFTAGLIPVTAHQIARLKAMKTEMAVAEAARHVPLRGSIFE